ncbi:hypothetical protein LOC70_07340 [Rhodopirellula sp. JC737]|nr:hypothetical protein [Rhodopirellula sp. JC737]
MAEAKRFEEATARAKEWKILVDAAPTTRSELDLAVESIQGQPVTEWPGFFDTE